MGGGISVADRRGHLRCRQEGASPLQMGGGISIADGRGDLCRRREGGPTEYEYGAVR